MAICPHSASTPLARERRKLERETAPFFVIVPATLAVLTFASAVSSLMMTP